MISTKQLQVLLAAAIAVLALGAIGASAASATVVRAKFSTSSFKLTGSNLTITRGAESKTCTPSAISVNALESSFFAGNSSEGTKFTCTDLSYLLMNLSGEARYDTVTGRYYLHVGDVSNSEWSPWGSYFQQTGGTDDWTWVNGSGATPSTIPLSEQYVGYTVEPFTKITITGTLTAKTSSGGLVTLSH